MDVCSICLDKITMNAFNLRCSHRFHEGCVTEWFSRANTCPVCRAQVSIADMPHVDRMNLIQNIMRNLAHIEEVLSSGMREYGRRREESEEVRQAREYLLADPSDDDDDDDDGEDEPLPDIEADLPEVEYIATVIHHTTVDGQELTFTIVGE